MKTAILILQILLLSMAVFGQSRAEVHALIRSNNFDENGIEQMTKFKNDGYFGIEGNYNVILLLPVSSV